MKKFVIIACVCVALCFFGAYLVVFHGADLSLFPHQSSTASFKAEGKELLVEKDGGWEELELRGVNMGSSIPGHFPTDYAIDRETYLRWFGQIKDMGANSIRVHMLMGSSFYEAFYEFNEGRDDPLYLVQGVYLDDYAAYSHMDAYQEGYLGALREDAHAVVDAVHGRLYAQLGRVSGAGSYQKDVSSWVAAYAVGVPWDTRAVAYTDHVDEGQAPYEGAYLKTTPDATAFESMLARVGDDVLQYEATRYGSQRLVGFVNSPITDPFAYPEDIRRAFNKHASVDIDHILATDQTLSGVFALYHVYPADPDFAAYLEPGEAPWVEGLGGNTYQRYLEALVNHHEHPVVVGEYGLPSSRGVAFAEKETGRDQGNLNEAEQAALVVQTYRDIEEAGCAGSLVYEWQDEWSRRTWNTVYSTDQLRTPFWSDAQTVDQAYGILAFDPGEQESVCYVDGSDEEWRDVAPVASTSEQELSVLYDERYLYLKVAGSAVSETSTIYLPLDVTDQSGATSAELVAGSEARSNILLRQDYAGQTVAAPFTFDRAADFLLVVNGKSEGQLYVQERYDAARAMMLQTVEGRDPYAAVPEIDSPLFKPVLMAQTTLSRMALEQPLPTLSDGTIDTLAMESFEYDLTDAMAETGALVHGNGNPASPDFDSLADYCFGDGFVEVRIPWQMLNFSDPSKMMVHDDYYEHYGVESHAIDGLHLAVGILQEGESGTAAEMLELQKVELEGWGDKVTSHERLKAVYYALQDAWAEKRSE